jgi:hypothetical protein
LPVLPADTERPVSGRKHIGSYDIVLVIPGNEDLRKFFDFLNARVFQNKLNILFYPSRQTPAALANKLKALSLLVPFAVEERQRLKAFYRNNLADISNRRVYFFSRHFTDSAFHFLEKLAERNTLVHIPDPAADVWNMTGPDLLNLRDWAWLLALKAVYGTKLTIWKYDGRRTTGIPDTFMKKHVESLPRETRDRMIASVELKKYRDLFKEDFDVLYFGHAVRPEWADRDTLKAELNRVFKLLAEYFPASRIGHKYHPSRKMDGSLITIGTVLPSFIPAEFLYHDNVKLYLSFWSMAIANVEKGIAMSLLDIISFKDPAQKRWLKDVLVKRSKSEILFPGSLDELESILVKRGYARISANK